VPKTVLHSVVAFLTHPVLQLVWLCIALTVPWISLAIDPYLWAMVSLFSLYVAVAMWLLVGAELFRVRHDQTLRTRMRNALLLSSAAAGHISLHLLWVIQADWRF